MSTPENSTHDSTTGKGQALLPQNFTKSAQTIKGLVSQPATTVDQKKEYKAVNLNLFLELEMRPPQISIVKIEITSN